MFWKVISLHKCKLGSTFVFFSFEWKIYLNLFFFFFFCSDLKSQSQYFQIPPEEEHIVELYSSASLTDMNELFLSEKMFTTLATISQSRTAAQQLIGCGFLGSLANIVSGKCFTLMMTMVFFLVPNSFFSQSGSSGKFFSLLIKLHVFIYKLLDFLK